MDGRVVKMLGDGVLFTSESPTSAATIALRMACLGDDLPPVHDLKSFGAVPLFRL